MNVTVDAFVAEFDGRGRAFDAAAFAEAVGELRWRTDVRVVFLLLDAASTVDQLDDGVLLSIERARLPVVCAFDGAVAGAAARLVAACDLRLCSQTASLPFEAEVEELPADSALARGAVSRVVPPAELVTAGRSLARTIGSRGPYATQLAKEAIRRGSKMPIEQALRFETDLTLLLQTTKDRAEGVRAFIEKRPPVFTHE